MTKSAHSLPATKDQILRDYKTGWQSRYLSMAGRKEVLTGKAKFGIFGDGKEIPQLVLAHFSKKATGDRVTTATRR